MTTELTKAAQQALEQLEFLNACYPHKTATDAADALRRALTQRPAAQAERWLVAAVDAAMVEMKNISPPLRRSECERLIRAAAEHLPAPQQATPEPVRPNLPVAGYSNARGQEEPLVYLNDVLAQQATPEPLTGCNCRWQGGTQVEWCELHLAHKDAIHEWAQRAKAAEAALKATPEPVGEVVAWQRRDRNIVTGEWSAWREDDDIEEELDPEWAERRPLFARPAPGVPEGFDVQALTATGGGHKYPLIVVRDKSSQLGEDVFPDEHPVIYGLLSALLTAAQAKGGAA